MDGTDPDFFNWMRGPTEEEASRHASQENGYA